MGIENWTKGSGKGEEKERKNEESENEIFDVLDGDPSL